MVSYDNKVLSCRINRCGVKGTSLEFFKVPAKRLGSLLYPVRGQRDFILPGR